MSTESAKDGMVNKELKMNGKTVLITGANTGLGLATAIDIARRGARVIMACRNMQKGVEARQQVVKESGSDNIVVKKLDLTSFQSVRECAADVNTSEARLDVLINNAGICMCPYSKTNEGYEMQFGTNHLGPFLFTNLLLDLLKQSAPSRIVTVSSSAHYGRLLRGHLIEWDDVNSEKKYIPERVYAKTKLMNILFSRELSQKLEGTGVTTYACQPGVVDTDLFRHVEESKSPTLGERLMYWARYFTRRWWRTPEQGAQTQIYCAVAPELEKETGKYYADCTLKEESEDAMSDDYAKRLWDISEEFTGLNSSDTIDQGRGNGSLMENRIFPKLNQTNENLVSPLPLEQGLV